MLDKFLKGLASPTGQDAIYMLGAALKDIGAGGSDNLIGAQQMLGQRRQKAEQQAAFDELVGGMLGGGQPAPMAPAAPAMAPAAGGYQGIGPDLGGNPLPGPATLTGADRSGNPGEIGGMTPDMRKRLIGYYRKTGNLEGILGLMKPEPVQTVEGPDGIYERRGAGKWTRVADYPDKDPTAPAGYTFGADGRLAFIPGGPADPDVLRNIAGLRRDVLVSKPMPARARTGGGGRGGGSVTTQPVAGRPWEKYGAR